MLQMNISTLFEPYIYIYKCFLVMEEGDFKTFASVGQTE